MATQTVEQALEQARAEARMLADQLRQARADMHRLGISDQNRTLVCAAVSGVAGILCGVIIGINLRKAPPPANRTRSKSPKTVFVVTV